MTNSIQGIVISGLFLRQIVSNQSIGRFSCQHLVICLLKQPQMAQAHVSRKSKRLIHESVTRCVTRC